MFGFDFRQGHLLDIVANPLNALLHVARDIIAFVAQEPGQLIGETAHVPTQRFQVLRDLFPGFGSHCFAPNGRRFRPTLSIRRRDYRSAPGVPRPNIRPFGIGLRADRYIFSRSHRIAPATGPETPAISTL